MELLSLSSYAPRIGEVPVTDLWCGFWRLSDLLLGQTTSRTTTLLTDNEQNRRWLTNLELSFATEGCRLINCKSGDCIARKPLQLDDTSKLVLQFKKVLLQWCNIQSDEQMNAQQLIWPETAWQLINWDGNSYLDRCTKCGDDKLTKLIAKANFIIRLNLSQEVRTIKQYNNSSGRVRRTWQLTPGCLKTFFGMTCNTQDSNIAHYLARHITYILSARQWKTKWHVDANTSSRDARKRATS